MSVDCTDFRMYEPFPFNPIWFSHKFNGVALRYELGICIQTCLIVWKNAPWPPGDYPDLLIYQCYLKNNLLQGECAEADEGYRGDDTTRTPNDFEGRADWRKMKSLARARHKTINGMFKEFKILRNV